MPLLLKGEAERYLDEILAADKDSYEKIVALLNDRYSLTEINQLEKISKLWELKQLPGDSALSFIENVRHLASQLGVLDDEVRRIVLRGLHPQIQAYVIQHDHDSIENVIKFTKVAENSYSTLPTETNMVEVFEKFDSKLEMLNTMVTEIDLLALLAIMAHQMRGTSTGIGYVRAGLDLADTMGVDIKALKCFLAMALEEYEGYEIIIMHPGVGSLMGGYKAINFMAVIQIPIRIDYLNVSSVLIFMSMIDVLQVARCAITVERFFEGLSLCQMLW